MSNIQTTPEQLESVLQSLAKNSLDFKVTGTPTKSTLTFNSVSKRITREDNDVLIFGNECDSQMMEINGNVCTAHWYQMIPDNFAKMELSCGVFHKLLNKSDASLVWNSDSECYNIEWGNSSSYVKIKGCLVTVDLTTDGVDFTTQGEPLTINFYDNSNNLIPHLNALVLPIDSLPSLQTVKISYDGGEENVYSSQNKGFCYGAPTAMSYMGNGHLLSKILYAPNCINIFQENNKEVIYKYPTYYEDTGEQWVIAAWEGSMMLFTYQNNSTFNYADIELVQNNANVYNVSVNLTSDQKHALDLQHGMNRPIIKIKCGNYEKKIDCFDGFVEEVRNGAIFFGNTDLLNYSSYPSYVNWGFSYQWGSSSLQVMFSTTETLPDEDIEIEFIFGDSVSVITPYYIDVSWPSQSNLHLIKQALLNHLDIYVGLFFVGDYNSSLTDLTDAFNGCYNLLEFGQIPFYATNFTRCFKDTYFLESIDSFPITATNITSCFDHSGVKEINSIPAVTSYNGAFDYCRRLKTIKKWDFVMQQNLTSLFRCCSQNTALSDFLIAFPSSTQQDLLKNFLIDKTKSYDVSFAPLMIDQATFSLCYVQGMQIPISELENTLKGFPVNTTSNPYIVDVTELTDAETNFSNGENMTPSVLADAITKGGRYVSLVESANSVSSEYFIYGLSGPNSQYLVGADFSKCTTIKSMSMCFVGCTNLTTVVLPPSLRDNLSAISGDEMSLFQNVALLGTFTGCSALSSVIGIPNNIEMLAETFHKSGITQAPNIPNSVKVMNGTFLNCENLTSISSLPTSLQLMDGCFSGCSHLTSVPSTITLKPLDNQMLLLFGEDPSVVNSTFEGCKQLTTSVTFTGPITEMRSTFYDCALITSVGPIPSTVTDMSYCFEGCHSLTTMPVIPNGVTNLDSSFEQCNALTSMTVLPKTVKRMSYAFSGCAALTSINIPAEVETLSHAFYGTAITEVPPIPETCSNLDNAFSYCQNLITVKKIPKTVTSMYASFANCNALETIEIWDAPHTLSYTLSYTPKPPFDNCPNLTSVIPKNLYSYTFLRATVFSSEKSVVQWNGFDVPFGDFHYYLDKLPNNDSAQSIDDEHSPRITELLAANCVGADTAVEGSIQYELQNTSNKKLKITIDEDCLKETVTSFSKCFKGCTNVYELEIPNSIETLTSMCEGCTNLSKISTLSDNVRSLNSAFKGCPNLTSIERMPAGVNDLTSAFETSSSAKLDIGEWFLPLASMATYPMQDAFKNRNGTIGLNKRKLSTSSKRWYLVKFEVDTTTSPRSCVYSVYDLDNNLVKSDSFPISTATINLSGKIDELVISGDLTSSKIQKAINYRTQFTSKTALDPANPNFVLWAKDPKKVVSNFLNEAEKVESCPVGTILSGLYTTAPDGFLLCNGQEVAIADYFELYTVIGSLAECQSENEGMFKVPDLRGRFLEGANGNLGKRIEAGLPNITGNLNSIMTDSGGSFSGAFYYNGKPRTRGWQGNDYDEIRHIGFDASRLPNSIYGKSDTVQPPAVCVNYIIKY